MKKLLLFIYLLVCCIGANAQYDRYRYYEVKILHHDYSTFPYHEIQRNRFTNEFVYAYDFDKKGNLKDSVLREVTQFLYDTTGNIIEEQRTNVAQNTTIKHGYFYNALNEVWKETSTFNSTYMVDRTYQFTYDSLGNEVSRYEYTKDTAEIRIFRNIYNKDGKLLKVVCKSNVNKQQYTMDTVYYKDGIPDVLVRLDAKGGFMYAYSYKYTPETIAIYFENEGGKKLQEICVYNANHQCAEIKGYGKYDQDENAPAVIEKYIYNANGTVFSDIFYRDRKITNYIKHYYKR